MAELLVGNIVGNVVGNVAERLSEVLVKESAALIGVERQVEWIKKELELMVALSEHVEHRGYGDKAGWEENLNQIARDAKDVIETYVIKSVKWRRTAVTNLFDRYNVGKELELITKRMKRISQRIMDSYENEQTAAVTVTGESSSSAPTIVAPAIEKLDHILGEYFSTHANRSGFLFIDSAREALRQTQIAIIYNDTTHTRQIVEDVRDELVRIQNIVSNLESASSRREIVWLEEVKEVCTDTVAVADRFIASRKRWTKSWLVAQITSKSIQMDVVAVKFREQMEDIRSQIRDTLRRRLTYGVGGESTSRPVPSLSLAPLSGFPIISHFINPKLFDIFLPTSASLWQSHRSMVKNLKSIQRDLDLMNALFSDVELEGQRLNERQKEWVDQLRLVAQHARWLIFELSKVSIFKRIRVARHIPVLLNQILEISHRKTTYDIANIPSIQDTEISVEHPTALPRLPKNKIEEIIQPIICENQLMKALARDLQVIGELDGVSKIWADEMANIASEMESIINEYAPKLEHKRIHANLLSLWFSLELTSKNYNIRKKLDEASRRRATYSLVQFRTRAESLSMFQVLRRRTQPVFNVRSRFVGFDEDVETLKAELLSDQRRRSVTSILGIEGTGKTELASLIFNDNAVGNQFRCRVWVSVPSNYTEEQLLKYVAAEAAKQIMEGQQEDKWTTQSVLATLSSTKYLIVVDGVETSLILDALKKAIPDMSTASRLLLTSRKVNVELHAGTTSYVHPLRLLDDDNGWMLLKNNLNLGGISPKLEEVGKDIVKKCCGLALEISKMEDLLSQKQVTIDDWSSVLEQLSREKDTKEVGSSLLEPLNQDQNQNPWLETLDTVNKNLPLYLRRCLFYFLLFPAESDIPVRRLVVLWVAESLVHSGEDKETPEQVAERYLAELIDLNMVQIAKKKRNGKVKTCRLPHALREFLLKKPNESRSLPDHPERDSNAVPRNSRILQVADRPNQKEDPWHKHIHTDGTIASATLKRNYQDVLSFLSFDYREGSKPSQEIGKFLNKCILSKCFLLLRVLDLERVYKPQLPKNIARLSRLRYLGLRRTYLESLPSSISSLLKLQTLDLKGTYIHELTSSIWKMELRHLFLSETYRSKFPPPPKRKSKALSDLQTLWGLFVNEETQVEGGLDKLENIRKLGLACQSMSSKQDKMAKQLDLVAAWIIKLKSLQSLRLKSRDEEGRPWNLPFMYLEDHMNLTDMYLLGTLSRPSFPPSLIELTLSHSKLEDDPMQILKDLPYLRSLSLLAESYTENRLVCNSQSFPQLQVLRLWKLNQLQEWCIEQEALPSLRQLEIRSCWCLKKLPDGLKHVETLLELKLTNMSMNINTEKHKIPPNCEVSEYTFEDNDRPTSE